MALSTFLSSSQSHSTSVALAVGIVYALGMYALAAFGGYQFEVEMSAGLLFYVVWITGGQLLIASVPTYLFVRYGYLFPLLMFGVIVVYTVSVELSGSADSSLAVYGFFWILPVALILVAAGIEYAVRATVLQ